MKYQNNIWRFSGQNFYLQTQIFPSLFKVTVKILSLE